MRIAYLNPCGQMGGAETSLLELLGAIRTAEPNWDLWLILGEDGPLVQKARALGIQVMLLAFPESLARLGDTGNSRLSVLMSMARGFYRTTKYARQLCSSLRVIKPDLIHTNGFKMHVLGCWARPAMVPVVWHIHDYVSKRPLMSKILQLFRGRCSVAIVNSNSVGRDLKAFLPAIKIRTIYNAVDTDRFAPVGSQLDLDSLSGLDPAPPDTLRIGLVATFARWKGHKLFLQALAALHDCVNFRGYIIGGPIYQTQGSQWSREELQEEVKQLGLSGKLGFTGFVEDTAAAIRSLDILIHASTLPEPFGMVIIEGMACGTPVIASRDGGAAELFVDGKNAVGHTRDHLPDLVSQIVRLGNDPDLRRRLSESGRATAEQVFQATRFAEEVIALYRSLFECGEKEADEQTEFLPERIVPATAQASKL
jgi:glycosyltransferase involved in cell wall biosynthesis